MNFTRLIKTIAENQDGASSESPQQPLEPLQTEESLPAAASASAESTEEDAEKTSTLAFEFFPADKAPSRKFVVHDVPEVDAAHVSAEQGAEADETVGDFAAVEKELAEEEKRLQERLAQLGEDSAEVSAGPVSYDDIKDVFQQIVGKPEAASTGEDPHDLLRKRFVEEFKISDTSRRSSHEKPRTDAVRNGFPDTSSSRKRKSSERKSKKRKSRHDSGAAG